MRCGRSGVLPITQFPSWYVNILFKDDVTVILLLRSCLIPLVIHSIYPVSSFFGHPFLTIYWARIFKLLRIPGIKSAMLCSLASQYDNPIPTRFHAIIGCSKIPALFNLYLASQITPHTLNITIELRGILIFAAGTEILGTQTDVQTNNEKASRSSHPESDPLLDPPGRMIHLPFLF